MREVSIKLKQLRADLDVLLTMADQVRDSRETSLAFTALQTGKMHVGNVLYELGEAKIYKHSNDPSSAVIDPYHVDKEIVARPVPSEWNAAPGESTVKVSNTKVMRKELDDYLVRAKMLVHSEEFSLLLPNAPFSVLFMTEVIVNLREAQNWYGMELARLR